MITFILVAILGVLLVIVLMKLFKSDPKPLPAPNSDFYQHIDVLTADEKAIVRKVRAYMETKVQQIINK